MFRSIQGLRGIAAVLVVFHHYRGILLVMNEHGVADIPFIVNWGNLEIFGAIGVPIFFVVSGFVMGIQAFDPGLRGALEFGAKRIARIVPSYWLLTLLAVPIFAVGDANLILKSLFFVAETPVSHPIIGPGWSLEYEMFFYLLFAGLVVGNVAGSAVRGMILLTLILGFMVLVNGITDGAWFNKFGSPMVLEFCAGMLIAKTYRLESVFVFSRLFLLIGLALTGYALMGTGLSWPTMRSLWSAVAFFLVIGLVCEEHRGRVWLKSGFFQVLGVASYAIYLIHQPLSALSFPYFLWRWKWHQAFDPNIALFLMCAWACAVGVAYCYLVERRMSGATRRWLLKLVNSAAVRFGTSPRGATEQRQ